MTNRSPEACLPTEHSHQHTHERAHAIPDLAFEKCAGLFRAAGDVARLKILARLIHGEWCVTELAEAMNEGLSTISQRLRILRAEGLVVRRRDGKHIYYALTDQHVAELITNALAHANEPRSQSPNDNED